MGVFVSFSNLHSPEPVDERRFEAPRESARPWLVWVRLEVWQNFVLGENVAIGERYDDLLSALGGPVGRRRCGCRRRRRRVGLNIRAPLLNYLLPVVVLVSLVGLVDLLGAQNYGE